MLGRIALLLVLVATKVSALSSFRNVTRSLQSDINNGVEAIDVGVGCGALATYEAIASNAASGSPEKPQFTYVIENPLAEFIVVHFANFNLPPNDYIVLRATDSSTEQFRYRGDEIQGAFYSNALYTNSIVMELYASGDTRPVDPFQCLGFKIDNYRYVAQGASMTGSVKEEVCGGDNSNEAMCFRAFPEAFKNADAVVRLLIHKSQGSFFCTGWLVGCEGHMLTNNHCIANQDHASNTEYEFRAQGSSCSSNCAAPLSCPGTVRARTSTFVATSQPLDYTLVKLDAGLANEYGYLRMRESGAVLFERIYIPQHPSGWGKRIAMKTDTGFGTVESLTTGGCAVNQVAYSLDTQGGSSGSPVIAWSDNAVVALHHCGGCPNTAINIQKVVTDMRNRNILPRCSIYTPPTPAPTPAPTQAPTPPPTQRPTPRPIRSVAVDGTIFSTATTTSVDYVDFTLTEPGDVELDILSMETSGDGQTFVDVNGDCNAGFVDTSMVLFRLTDAGIKMANVIAVNNDAPAGYGNKDGSISLSDSYMYLPLTEGRYRLAIGAAPLSPEQAIAKITPITSAPRICDLRTSNYGSYRLTIRTPVNIQAASPGSYIGSQCSSTYSVFPYPNCPYHREAALTRATVVDGTILRQQSTVSVDHIPFIVNAFGRITIEVSSYESQDGFTFVDVNGDCESAYIDPVAYVFRRRQPSDPLTPADLINAGDDDDNFAVRKDRRSRSFRDPFMTLALPAGNYLLVVGRYPLSLRDAINKNSAASVDRFTPEICGKQSNRGNYMVTFASWRDVAVTSPNSFQGRKCPANVGNVVCRA